MKFILSTIIIAITVLSCKKEPKTEIPATTDSIVADTIKTDTVPPLPSDTIRTDTVSLKNSMDTVRSSKNKTNKK